MKSIEIYRSKINIRQKGVDSMDSVDSTPVPQSRQDQPKPRAYTALCYILWGTYHRAKWASPHDQRVYHDGLAKSICISLTGASRKDALSKLDTNAYEFIEWWS
jgi:hypothetical protein